MWVKPAGVALLFAVLLLREAALPIDLSSGRLFGGFGLRVDF